MSKVNDAIAPLDKRVVNGAIFFNLNGTTFNIDDVRDMAHIEDNAFDVIIWLYELYGLIRANDETIYRILPPTKPVARDAFIDHLNFYHDNGLKAAAQKILALSTCVGNCPRSPFVWESICRDAFDKNIAKSVLKTLLRGDELIHALNYIACGAWRE